MAAKFETVDEYIGSFPPDVQVVLEKVRRAIRQAIPGAEEVISYGIAGVKLNGKGVVSFAGWKNHVAVYPAPVMKGALEKEVAPYRTEKSTLRFPLGQPLPTGLIERFVAALVEQRFGG